MASDSGIFWGPTLDHLLGKMLKGVECGGDGVQGWPCLIRVAVLGDELAAQFSRAQAGIQATRAELWSHSTLVVDERFDITQQTRQVVFGAHATTDREGIKIRGTTFQLMRACADGRKVAAEFKCRTPLPPDPGSLTVRAMQFRRTLPFSV
jgi:hypothetical protein